jgi:hypothetical protein
VIWKKVFESTSPIARKSRWGMHIMREWLKDLYDFRTGMLAIGEPALPYLNTLYETETHDQLRELLADMIAHIKQSSDTTK